MTESPVEPAAPAEAQTETDESRADPARRPVWQDWLSSRWPKRTTAADQPEVRDEAEAVTLESSARDFNPLPPEPIGASLSSGEIFVDLGRQLRKRREMLSLTLEEIERHTRIRSAFLKSLEAGAMDQLPSPVQTRGILANYAGFLDLDVDAIMLRFADALQARHRERSQDQPKPARQPMVVNTRLPPWRTFIAGDLLFGGGIAIVLILFAVWGVNRVLSLRAQLSPQQTGPSIPQVLLAGTLAPTLVQEVTLIPAPDTPLAAPTQQATADIPTLGADINVQVTILAVGRTLLRVTVDGQVKFDGRVSPGASYPFNAQRKIEITAGNASALRISYNGRDLGLMGNFGEVIDRVFTAQGVSTPTATRPPTATPTPNITLTPSATATPTATPTKTAIPVSP